MSGFVNLDQSGPPTPSTHDIRISSKRGVIRKRRSGLIRDEEIRNALNGGEAVSPSCIIERGISAASLASENQDGHRTSSPHHHLNYGMPSTDFRSRDSGTSPRAEFTGEQMMNNEVEEGYINVTSHRIADNYRASDRRQVSASTSSTSATSSHAIHTREATAEYTSSARVTSAQDASDIRRLQSENEWLYDWNAELQDNVEKLKAEAANKEREYRYTTRRLQTQVDTLQNALDEAERQNRSLEATVKHLKNQRSGESRGGGTQTVRPSEAFRGYTHSRSNPIGGIPASSSAVDSLGTSNSADSDINLQSGIQGSERDIAGTNQNIGHAGIRRVRKKVSWQDEINPSATLLSRPAPPPINVPGVGLPIAGIMKTSPNDRSPPRSPPSLQAYHLTPALPSVSEWVRTHPGGQRSQRRASDTPSPGPVKSLFEELKSAGQLLPSVSHGSSMSAHSTVRNPLDDTLTVSESGGGASYGSGPSGQEIEAENPDEDQNLTFRTVNPRDQEITIIERCTAVIEERGNDFWQRVQFYCVVGIFLAGVLSKGRDGVMELGRRT